ncbi:hypothetical protein G6F40_016706 [Rhizopus arrhizus]|nr:hypothetical protein G6F40_016706 [Rhizopus arrhizus]
MGVCLAPSARPSAGSPSKRSARMNNWRICRSSGENPRSSTRPRIALAPVGTISAICDSLAAFGSSESWRATASSAASSPATGQSMNAGRFLGIGAITKSKGSATPT